MVTADYPSLIDLIQESGGYVLCPGIQPAWYEEKYKIAGCERVTVRHFKLPTKRYESIDCLLWLNHATGLLRWGIVSSTCAQVASKNMAV